tara:strand:- start:153 stop:389 length:237 start_codon:yes stop_codon:yes gene_type:complete
MAIRRSPQHAKQRANRANRPRVASGVRGGVEQSSSPIAQKILKEYQAAAPKSEAIRALAQDANTPQALRLFLQSVMQA